MAKHIGQHHNTVSLIHVPILQSVIQQFKKKLISEILCQQLCASTRLHMQTECACNALQGSHNIMSYLTILVIQHEHT